MKWIAEGEWQQDRGFAVLVDAAHRREIPLTDALVTRCVRQAAAVPSVLSVPAFQDSGTVTLYFESSPTRPEAELAPLFAFLKAFGPLEEPTASEGQMVFLRDFHSGLVAVGGVWNELQEAFAQADPRRRRRLRLACQERVLALIEEQFTGDISSDFFAGKRPSIRPVLDGTGFDLRVTVAPVTLEGRIWLWLLERVRTDPVFATCKRQDCGETFEVPSSRGRPPRYCPAHRSERDYMARLRAERKNPVIHRPAIDEINEKE